MLKTYGEISRFMDGPAVNVGVRFVYLKDAKGKERIGTIYHNDLKAKFPFLEFHDINSGESLRFNGESHNFSYNLPFTWFSDIQEIGLLYHDFDNDIQRYSVMNNDFHKFVFNELYFEIAKRYGAPIGERAKFRMEQDLKFPAVVYYTSFEYLYAIVNSNRDILLIHNPPREIRGNRVPSIEGILKGSDIQFSPTLNEFIEFNPCLKNLLAEVPVGENGRYYESVGERLNRIRDAIPNDVLEAMYQQFKAEIEGKRRLETIKAENPREKLEKLVKYKKSA